jgi:hypothetical protein
MLSSMRVWTPKWWLYYIRYLFILKITPLLTTPSLLSIIKNLGKSWSLDKSVQATSPRHRRDEKPRHVRDSMAY